jgi:hypothetical protein
VALVDDRPSESTQPDPEALIPEARELHRRRLRRRAIAVLVGVPLLGAGGIALFGGGGGSAAEGLSGPLPAGITARVADPAGGMPWGIRVVRTRGWTCVQLGRLRGSELGLIARDGLAGDDGRFLPFGPSTTYQARCAQNDANGHAFMTVELGAQPTSGAGGGYTGMSPCRTAADVAGFKRALASARLVAIRGAAPKPPQVCPSGDLRFIQYGLLGPDATSVTYTLGRAEQVERTHGSDGAYLVVGPSTPAFCAHLPQGGFCGESGVAPNSIGGGMIVSVRYRSAPACPLNHATGRLPVVLAHCPLVGYVAPKPPLNPSQVAAPVSFQVIKADRFCLRIAPPRYGFAAAQATDLGPYVPCTSRLVARDNRPWDVAHGTLIIFSWTARQAVTSSNSQYQFLVALGDHGQCGGQGGSTYGRITVGERLTRAVIVPANVCGGTVTGTIGYDADLGPGGGEAGGYNPGRDGSLLVGRFTASIR